MSACHKTSAAISDERVHGVRRLPTRAHERGTLRVHAPQSAATTA